MDDDTEPPMDVGEPRLLVSSHRAISDGLSGFVNPSDIRALRVVSKTAYAITTAYHSGPGWFEMDVDVSSSSTAAGALRILKSCSKSLVMDLAFVLEGQTPDALPEKILGTVEWNHFDLDPDNSPVIKVCADDN